LDCSRLRGNLVKLLLSRHGVDGLAEAYVPGWEASTDDVVTQLVVQLCPDLSDTRAEPRIFQLDLHLLIEAESIRNVGVCNVEDSELSKSDWISLVVRLEAHKRAEPPESGVVPRQTFAEEVRT
jgi:hypothetical protein